MKTFRQNLHIWLEEQKNTSNNDEVIEMLTNVQKHIKKNEKEEEHLVNAAYESGYYDKELNRVKKGNYYQQNFKMHDKLKQLLNLN
jgi:hypothetical protein